MCMRCLKASISGSHWSGGCLRGYRMREESFTGDLKAADSWRFFDAARPLCFLECRMEDSNDVHAGSWCLRCGLEHRV